MVLRIKHDIAQRCIYALCVLAWLWSLRGFMAWVNKARNATWPVLAKLDCGYDCDYPLAVTASSAQTRTTTKAGSKASLPMVRAKRTARLPYQASASRSRAARLTLAPRSGQLEFRAEAGERQHRHLAG